MRDAYLDLMKSVLNNSLYLGTDSSACHEKYYAISTWTIPRSCLPHTLCNRSQLDFLGDIMAHLIANHIQGDFLEVGVWRGGVSIFMKAFLKAHNSKKTVWVADTFSGIPLSTDKFGFTSDIVDKWEDRWEARIEEVQLHFRRYNMLDENVKFLVGEISKTVVAPIRQISLARLDVDSYESYMDAMTSIYPLMTEGGCIIFDDWHLDSCRAALNDFSEKNGLTGQISETFNGKNVDAHLFVRPPR